MEESKLGPLAIFQRMTLPFVFQAFDVKDVRGITHHHRGIELKAFPRKPFPLMCTEALTSL